MSKSLLRTDKEIEEICEQHRMTVYRVCFANMKNPVDTDDAVQETFFRLISGNPKFESEEHEKAWLIRTKTNLCKDELKHRWRKHENIDDHLELQTEDKIKTDDVSQTVYEE